MHPPKLPVVTLALTRDEALILFDWSQRQETEQYAGEFFVDNGERIALANLTASLESVVDEVFSSDYGEALAAAKARIAVT